MAAEPAVELTDVTKVYDHGPRPVTALNRLSLRVAAGSFVSLMGPSGSGKSTILNLVAGLDAPTSGRVVVAGRSLADLDDGTLTDLRRTTTGVIFQFFNLLPMINALDNVTLPLRGSGVPRRTTRERAERALARVGLANRMDHLPAELSGGEMQRVAIARALVIEPALVLADEPTGNLDSVTSDEILCLLRDYARERGATVVLVTHSAAAAEYGERIVTLRDGAVVADVETRAAEGTGGRPSSSSS